MTHRFLIGVGAALLTLSASVARADITAVTNITISGLPAMAAQAPGAPKNNVPTTTTSYFKNGKSRTETGGKVVISDPAADKITTLNPAAKTYYVSTAAAAMANATAALGPNAGFMALIKFNAKTNVTPTSETQTILGKQAKAYDYVATVTITADPSIPLPPDSFPTMKYTGRRWVTEDLNDADAAAKIGNALSNQLGEGNPIMGGVKDMVKTLSTIKGFPLKDDVAMTISFPPGSPLVAAVGDTIPDKISFKVQVTSISDSPLSDDLFTVPADYKLVTPPAPAAPGPPASGNL